MMTARSRPASPSGAADSAWPEAMPAAGSRAGIVTAAGMAGVAAVAQSVAVITGVVTGAEPAFLSWPLLVALAVLPAALALGLLRRTPGIAAGVLVGAGVVAACGAIADLQVAIDATRLSRPDLLLPQRAVAPRWWALGLLVSGKLLLAASGAVALRVSRSLPDDTSGRDRVRQPLAMLAATAGLLLAIGALVAPYTSTDPLLLDYGALDGPPLVLASGVLLLLAVPAAAALGVAGRAGGFANGLLGGLALGGLTLALPPLVAGWLLPFLRPSPGPVLVLIGAACLGVLATLPGRWLAALLLRREAGPGVPRQRVLYSLAGALAVVAGCCAVAGAMTPLVIVPGGGGEVTSPVQWLLYPLGLGLVLLGMAAFVPAAAARLRPALSVAWAGALLVGAQVLTVPIAADELPIETRHGAAGWWTFGAIVMAVLLAVCSLVAGVVAREETGRLPSVAGDGDAGIGGRLIGGGAALAGVLALGAFLLPVVRTDDYVTAALSERVDLAFWGVLFATVAVLGVLLLVPRSGREPAIALLVAVTGVVGLRLLEWYAVDRRYDVEVAPGALFAIAAVVVLAALTATVAVRGRSAGR